MPPKREHRSGEIALLMEQNEFLREQLRLERERCERLIGEVLALRREGFAATVQYDAPAPVAPLPAVVAQAIAQRSDPLTPERRELERRAADYVRAGLEPDEVARSVLDGENVDL